MVNVKSGSTIKIWGNADLLRTITNSKTKKFFEKTIVEILKKEGK